MGVGIEAVEWLRYQIEREQTPYRSKDFYPDVVLVVANEFDVAVVGFEVQVFDACTIEILAYGWLGVVHYFIFESIHWAVGKPQLGCMSDIGLKVAN